MCHTGGLRQLLPAFVPSFLFGAPSALVDLAVDDARHILYARTQASGLQASVWGRLTAQRVCGVCGVNGRGYVWGAWFVRGSVWALKSLEGSGGAQGRGNLGLGWQHYGTGILWGLGWQGGCPHGGIRRLG